MSNRSAWRRGQHLPRNPKGAGGLPLSLALFLGFLDEEPIQGRSQQQGAPLFSFSLCLKIVSIPTACGISLFAITETKKIR